MPRACPAAGACAAASVLAFALWAYKGPLYGCPPEVPLAAAVEDDSLDTVHVLYASDAKQLPGLLTSMISVGRNLAADERCTFHVIVAREDMELLRSLLPCFQREMASRASAPAVELHEVRWPPFNITEFPIFWVNDTWGYRKPWIWSKVYPHEYLPSAPRAIWLDNDVVVDADLGPLYRMRMTRPFAAVVDQEYPHELNTGMLLYDLQRYRSEDVAGAVEAWLRQWWAEALRPGGRFTHQAFHEQTALSELFLHTDERRRAHLLDWRWNAVGLWNLWRMGSCVHEAHVLHFNGFPLKYWDFRFPAWTIHRWKHGLLARYVPRGCAALEGRLRW